MALKETEAGSNERDAIQMTEKRGAMMNGEETMRGDQMKIAQGGVN